MLHSYDSGRSFAPTEGCIRLDPANVKAVRYGLEGDSNRRMPIYVRYPKGGRFRG
jgi:hypothetical protein